MFKTFADQVLKEIIILKNYTYTLNDYVMKEFRKTSKNTEMWSFIGWDFLSRLSKLEVKNTKLRRRGQTLQYLAMGMNLISPKWIVSKVVKIGSKKNDKYI